MRNVRYLSVVAIVMSCLLIAVPGNALFNSDVKKAKEFMHKIGFSLPEYNPFMNNIAQAIELIHHRQEGAFSGQ